MRKLAQEITDLPHGRLKWIAEQTGLSEKTLNKVVKHGRGSEDSARKIAAVVGCPDRWHELLTRTCDIPAKPTKRKATLPPKALKTKKQPAEAGSDPTTQTPPIHRFRKAG